MTLSIRHRLIILALSGALLALIVGGAAYLGLKKSQHYSALLEDSALAVRAAMNADMKHDNTRAEIMRGALAAQAGDLAQVHEVQQAVATNVQALLDSLASAESKAPTPASRAAMATSIPVARLYAEAAIQAIAAIQQQPQATAAALVAFDQSFHTLETALDTSADAIEEGATQIKDETSAASADVMRSMLVVVVSGLSGLLIFSVWTIRAILKPLAGLQAAVRHLNADDGDLSRRLPSSSAAEFRDLSLQFNGFLEKIAGVVGHVQGSARTISCASTQIAGGNQDLSKRTEQTSANLQQAASSLEQITTSVQLSADAAQRACGLADKASDVAARGGEDVSRVVSTMEEINTASRKISDITGVIDGIAFQTNILALNAAVEAARAGEEGRGFAVVASEVRMLARRSAEAAREIKTLINTSVEKVEAGGAYVRDAGATMAEIVASVKRVSTTINEITQATTEQRNGIVLVNEAVNDLDRTTQQNAALVEQTAAAAQEMAQQAQSLATTVNVFRTVA
jgi:methyl-accepting chemotaxis protein